MNRPVLRKVRPSVTLDMLRFDGITDCGGDWELQYCINAAHSDDENASIGISDYSPLNGKRWIAGGVVNLNATF
ncbi:MAG: hypothetical protein ACKVIW_02460 [bacterium]